MTRRLLATVIIALVSTGAAAQEHGAETRVNVDMTKKLEDTPKLSVRGEAELRRPADRVHLSVGVVSEAPTAEAALAENSTQMKAVIAALEVLKLTDDELEAGRFQIRPKYASRPRQPKADWKPQVIGYEAINTITIKTTKLDLTGRMITAATEAGANTAEVQHYDLVDDGPVRQDAIREATQDALTDAHVLADAAGLRLVRILSIHLDTPSVQRHVSGTRARMAAVESSADAPIRPGNVTVRASVNVQYEIAPQD